MDSSEPIALFGGTFNPPHWGHIKPLQQAMKAVGLRKVGLMPCNIPPHKKALSISKEHRLAMLNEVCKIDRNFYIEPIELDSNDVSYTVNTLEKMKKISGKNIYFIMGTDSFQSIQTWYKWPDIFKLCNIIVLNRENQPLKKLQEVAHYISCGPHDAVSLADKEVLTASNGNVVSCHFPIVTVSSTIVRDKLQSGSRATLEAGNLLPIEVLNYINQHRLYE
ncbi:MAG: nicotinate-nucleotide adenylyltransferase [Glaciecola sp.]|jgi:nicotinate-nucleotide adenylyltransferase